MTDVGGTHDVVPARLGVSARVEGGSLFLDLEPSAEVLHHGIVRASVLAFLVDAAAGIVVDEDPDAWALTTDLSVRARPVPPGERVTAVATVLRRGRRSASCTVELTDAHGVSVGSGATGFALVPRRPTDPPKPIVTIDEAVHIITGPPALARPLRDEAAIEVIDPAAGVVEVVVTPELRNPAGTLQGAMVALVAEAAAEDLLETRFGVDAVVTDLDVRYLAQASSGPVRSRARLLGEGPGAAVEVELSDRAEARPTTHVYARAAVLG